jgi:hypothetical protein
LPASFEGVPCWGTVKDTEEELFSLLAAAFKLAAAPLIELALEPGV